MNILTILATIILPLLIGYILGRNRDNNRVVFTKKLSVYSDIIYEINASKYSYVELELNEKELKDLIDLKEKIESGEEVVQDKISKKFDSIEKTKGFLKYKDRLIRLFAPARLLGSKKVVDELREYFSLTSEYFSTENKKEKTKIASNISKSTMELEQLMRKDLGNSRHLSKIDLRWHHHKNSNKS